MCTSIWIYTSIHTGFWWIYSIESCHHIIVISATVLKPPGEREGAWQRKEIQRWVETEPNRWVGGKMTESERTGGRAMGWHHSRSDQVMSLEPKQTEHVLQIKEREYKWQNQSQLCLTKWKQALLSNKCSFRSCLVNYISHGLVINACDFT